MYTIETVLFTKLVVKIILMFILIKLANVLIPSCLSNQHKCDLNPLINFPGKLRIAGNIVMKLIKNILHDKNFNSILIIGLTHLIFYAYSTSKEFGQWPQFVQNRLKE